MSEPTDEPTREQVEAALARSREDSTAAGVAAGLEDARATLAEIWRRHDDEQLRHRAMRALGAVISAEATLKAADAFVIETGAGRPRRSEAFEELRKTCILRLLPRGR